MNFLKHFFSKTDHEAVENQIDKQYIFVELDLEHWYESFYARDLSAAVHRDLEGPENNHIHQLFTLGAQVVPNVALNTSVEIFVRSTDFDYRDVERVGLAARHAFSSVDAIMMNAVIWMRDGSIETIPFELNIKPDEEMSRLTAALLTIQKEIPFYFGEMEKGLFTIKKQVMAETPASTQDEFQIFLVELYVDSFSEETHNDSRKITNFIELDSVSDREMTTAGWVIHFDNEKMKAEDDDLSLLKRNIMHMIFGKIDRFSTEGDYTGWIAENIADPTGTGPYGETTTFILTSSEPLHAQGKLHQDVMNYLKSVKGFLREDGGYPLKYESIPLFRREENGFGLATVNEAFLTKVDSLYRKKTNDSNNLYHKLLDMKK